MFETLTAPEADAIASILTLRPLRPGHGLTRPVACLVNRPLVLRLITTTPYHILGVYGSRPTDWSHDATLPLEVCPWKYAELLHTAWAVIKSNPTSRIGVMSLFISPEEYEANTKKLRGTLMTEWWDIHADAGPREYPGVNRVPDAPALKILRWNTSRNAP